jgi:putative membrane protein insertion efficiency factor
MSSRAEKLVRLARRAAIIGLSLPIHAYRYMLSPLLPPSCRFEPSCSAYALEALAVHGPFKGTWLAVRRLSRCHPITFLGGGSGIDPVPPG